MNKNLRDLAKRTSNRNLAAARAPDSIDALVFSTFDRVFAYFDGKVFDLFMSEPMEIKSVCFHDGELHHAAVNTVTKEPMIMKTLLGSNRGYVYSIEADYLFSHEGKLWFGVRDKITNEDNSMFIQNKLNYVGMFSGGGAYYYYDQYAIHRSNGEPILQFDKIFAACYHENALYVYDEPQNTVFKASQLEKDVPVIEPYVTNVGDIELMHSYNGTVCSSTYGVIRDVKTGGMLHSLQLSQISSMCTVPLSYLAKKGVFK